VVDAKVQQPLGVDHDRTLVRQDRAANTAAGSKRDDPKALRTRQLEQLAHLLGALGPNHGARAVRGQLTALNID
jgi:hypothetical protein